MVEFRVTKFEFRVSTWQLETRRKEHLSVYKSLSSAPPPIEYRGPLKQNITRRFRLTLSALSVIVARLSSIAMHEVSRPHN